MELDLKEIGQTLAIGALAIFGLLALVQIFERAELMKAVVRLLYEPLKDKFGAHRHHIFLGAVYLALIFAFGLTLEDLSKNIASERSPEVLEWLYRYGIPRDKAMRVETLFENPEPKLEASATSNEPFPHPPPREPGVTARAVQLTLDLVDDGNIAPEFSDAGYDLQRLLKKGSSVRDHAEDERVALLVKGEDLENIVNQFYYRAHNEVYQKATTAQELEKIATRMDFARAMLFASLSLGGLLILFFIYYLGEYCFWRLRASRWAAGARARWKLPMKGFLTAVSVLMYGVLGCLYYEGLAMAMWPVILPIGWVLLVFSAFFLSEWALGDWFGKRYPNSIESLESTFDWKMLLQSLVAGLAILLFIGLGQKSFISESKSYNIRVFGYYQTFHHKSPDPAGQKTKPDWAL